jgi:uncharacterized protein
MIGKCSANAILMRMFTAVFLLMVVPRSFGVEIPSYVPNVVDTAGVLSPADTQKINMALEQVRASADIWGAVFIVPSLDGESIEAVAERAFKKWEFGAKGKDNGLLLVLSTGDRQSRFEVGYGLEGEITDIHAMRALEKILRPYMRKGDVPTAVISSFNYLAGIRRKSSGLMNDPISAAVDAAWYQDKDVQRGLAALAIFLALLWFFRPFLLLALMRRARALENSHRDYKISGDAALNNGVVSIRFLLFGGKKSGMIPMKMFLSVNPGVFIYLLAMFEPYFFVGILVVLLLIFAAIFHVKMKKYRSGIDYQLAVAAERRAAEQSSSSGSGSSSRSTGSSSRSSSSRSSSGSSSSSGGGRSGGGGASSGW